MALIDKTEKKSDLLACYRELASGEPIEALEDKYVKAEVLVALELFTKGVTVRQLQEFIKRRDAHLAKMRIEKL